MNKVTARVNESQVRVDLKALEINDYMNSHSGV
jgi:hypothetical protein